MQIHLSGVLKTQDASMFIESMLHPAALQRRGQLPHFSQSFNKDGCGQPRTSRSCTIVKLHLWMRFRVLISALVAAPIGLFCSSTICTSSFGFCTALTGGM